jgi:hypothetical protein
LDSVSNETISNEFITGQITKAFSILSSIAERIGYTSGVTQKEEEAEDGAHGFMIQGGPILMRKIWRGLFRETMMKMMMWFQKDPKRLGSQKSRIDVENNPSVQDMRIRGKILKYGGKYQWNPSAFVPPMNQDSHSHFDSNRKELEFGRARKKTSIDGWRWMISTSEMNGI